MAKHKRSLAALLQDMAIHTTTSMPFKELVSSLQSQWLGQSATVARRVQQMIQQDTHAFGWMWVSDQEVMPIHVAVRGMQVRIIPTAEMLREGYLDMQALLPFCHHHDQLRFPDLSETPFWPFDPFVDIGPWIAQHHVMVGDHIVAQFDHHDGRVVHLRVDRAEQQDLTKAQDSDALVQGILLSQPLDSEAQLMSAVLLAYCASPLRMEYPGLPWTALVHRVVPGRADAEHELMQVRQAIDLLQMHLRAQRVRDSENGLWDGMALRFSAARIAIESGDERVLAQRMALPPIDMRLDYSDRIDDAIARGLYDVQMIEHGSDDDDVDDEDDDDDDFADINAAYDPFEEDVIASGDYLAALRSDDDDDDDDDNGEDDDALFDVDPELLDAHMFAVLFANRHPALEELSMELLRNLTMSERRRVIHAETDDDYNAILSSVLQRILPSSPQFMQTLRPTKNFAVADITDGGQIYAAFELAEYVAKQDAEDMSLRGSRNDDVFATGGEAVFAVESALRESEQLVDEFVKQLTAQAMRPSTIRRKRAFVHDFAVFMARYYTLPLQQVTYAHLDEYIFFYFPRHTRMSGARSASDMIRAIRDMYQLQTTPATPQQRVVSAAMYDRRHQADEVLRILVSLHRYSIDVTALVVHLFAPYTA